MFRLDRVLQRVIEISFYALFFATPLLFTSINSELFELPKMFFVWFAAIIILGAWIIRMILNARIIFRRTLLDIPLLLFLVSQFLSFFVSIDRHISFWGYYERFNGGIASLLSYAILYWAFVSNLTIYHALSAIRYLLIATLVVTLWGIPAHFGYDPTCAVFGYGLTSSCWSEQFKPEIRIFSTLGQPNWLASWLVAIMPIGWALAISKIKKVNSYGVQKSKIHFKIQNLLFYGMISSLLLLALIYTKSESGLIGFIISLTIFSSPFILNPIRQNMRRSLSILFALTLSLIVIISLSSNNKYLTPIQNCLKILSSQPPITSHQPPITPSSDIRCIVWKGALSIWKSHPILGTGPETFAHSYYRVKPTEHNLTSEWNFLYNKAHNEYLNYLANTGLTGLTSYLILIVFSIYLIISKSEFIISKKIPSHKRISELGIGHSLDQLEIRSIRNLQLGLLAGYCSLLATNFFGFSVVPTQLLFFLYPAIAVAVIQDTRYEIRIGTSGLSRLFLIISILFLITYLLSLVSHYFLADVHYEKSQQHTDRGEYQQALSSIRSALELRPSEPLYWSKLSSIASSISILSTDSELIQESAEIARDASDTSIKISINNVPFWKTRANVFNKLGSIDPKYMDQAQTAYEKALALAPTDAQILYNLAFFYWQVDDLEKSREQVEKALFLRPNYEEAQKLLEDVNKEKKGEEAVFW